MKKWEYLTTSLEIATMNQTMAAHGEQGWELVSVTVQQAGFNTIYFCIFKREKMAVIVG